MAHLVEPAYEGDFLLEKPLELECGRSLTRASLHYAVYGQLNEARDNVVLVCHALSGSALAGTWWPGLFGTNTAIDPEDAEEAQKQILRFAQDDKTSLGEPPTSVDGRRETVNGIVDLSRDCAICVNLLGSCYGSAGPGSVDPGTGLIYGPRFPLIAIRDNVRAQKRLLDSLGIQRVKLAIGGSIGGMQALEWAMLFPDSVERAVVIAVAPLGALGLAMNHIQRKAIMDDPDWLGGGYISAGGASDGVRPACLPNRGLALARRIGMLSYKSPQLFDERFGRKPDRSGEDPWKVTTDGGGLTGERFDVAGFLDYQGERFLERFDANAYLAIMRTMDTWDPVRGFASADDAFGRIQAEVIFVGISSDWLFPPGDVKRLAEQVKASGVRAEYREMITDHGHDAFLAEQAALVKLLHLGHGEG